uniref:Peptidase_M14 domain-containing protein n=1 Tax=Strongyloides stercoralis TaxID=6248 RepID=A0AAF5DRN1_STRER
IQKTPDLFIFASIMVTFMEDAADYQYISLLLPLLFLNNFDYIFINYVVSGKCCCELFNRLTKGCEFSKFLCFVVWSFGQKLQIFRTFVFCSSIIWPKIFDRLTEDCKLSEPLCFVVWSFGQKLQAFKTFVFCSLIIWSGTVDSQGFCVLQFDHPTKKCKFSEFLCFVVRSFDRKLISAFCSLIIWPKIAEFLCFVVRSSDQKSKTTKLKTSIFYYFFRISCLVYTISSLILILTLLNKKFYKSGVRLLCDPATNKFTKEITISSNKNNLRNKEKTKINVKKGIFKGMKLNRNYTHGKNVLLKKLKKIRTRRNKKSQTETIYVQITRISLTVIRNAFRINFKFFRNLEEIVMKHFNSKLTFFLSYTILKALHEDRTKFINLPITRYGKFLGYRKWCVAVLHFLLLIRITFEPQLIGTFVLFFLGEIHLAIMLIMVKNPGLNLDDGDSFEQNWELLFCWSRIRSVATLLEKTGRCGSAGTESRWWNFFLEETHLVIMLTTIKNSCIFFFYFALLRCNLFITTVVLEVTVLITINNQDNYYCCFGGNCLTGTESGVRMLLWSKLENVIQLELNLKHKLITASHNEAVVQLELILEALRLFWKKLEDVPILQLNLKHRSSSVMDWKLINAGYDKESRYELEAVVEGIKDCCSTGAETKTCKLFFGRNLFRINASYDSETRVQKLSI